MLIICKWIITYFDSSFKCSFSLSYILIYSFGIRSLISVIIPNWTVLANPPDMFLYVLMFWMPFGVSKNKIKKGIVLVFDQRQHVSCSAVFRWMLSRRTIL